MLDKDVKLYKKESRMNETLELVELDNSIQLARAFGLFFSLYGLAIWIHKDKAGRILSDLKQNSFLQLVTGILPLFIGSFMVAFHNTWDFHHVGAVTLVGWIIFIIGLTLTLFMSRIMKMIDIEKQGITLLKLDSIFSLSIGLFMLYIGYFS